jgi:hypothetical protein
MRDPGDPFSKNALPANLSGRLDDEQSRRWTQIAKRRRQSVRGVAYVFAAMGGILLLVNGPAAKAAARANGSLAFLGIAAIMFVGVSLEPVNADVREGRVESVEGAISKSYRQFRPPGSRNYYLDVAGRRLQAVTGAEYKAAPDAGYVRVYFLPRSRRVVNLEQLADPPIPTGSGAAQEILQNYVHALRSRDRTTIAEANASLAALKHVVEGTPAPPDAAGRAHPVLRADDLYGTWTNPMVMVRFMENGIVTLTSAVGAIRREGHWSVDANGRLLTDATGSMEPLHASLEGRQLTIVIEGQRMAFTRGDSG